MNHVQLLNNCTTTIDHFYWFVFIILSFTVTPNGSSMKKALLNSLATLGLELGLPSKSGYNSINLGTD